jgi:hypothetical protein
VISVGTGFAILIAVIAVWINHNLFFNIKNSDWWGNLVYDFNSPILKTTETHSPQIQIFNLTLALIFLFFASSHIHFRIFKSRKKGYSSILKYRDWRNLLAFIPHFITNFNWWGNALKEREARRAPKSENTLWWKHRKF